ncbi:hypothetical protein [Telluribacter humicola]|uniref:hypothetical protein n=1 Tax=Telluribacter humicola TaxID=1720261 RepID=UPI001A958343|nr:hypothetical protein [Telluribacter humicola]
MDKPNYKDISAQTPARPEENPARPTDPGAPAPVTPGKQPEVEPQKDEPETRPSSPDPEIPELNPDPMPEQDPVRPLMQNLC